MPRINRRKLRQQRASGAPGPGYEGQREIGGRVVEDPYDPSNTITVPVNVRHDPLQRMFGQRDIDTAQLKAGEHLREAFDATSACGIRAIDPSRDVVDGGPGFGGLSERAIRSAARLREAQALLGWQSYRLVVAVVCQGLNGTLISEQSSAKVDRKTVQFAVRNGLEQLAIMWGYASDPRLVRKQASMVGMIRDRAAWAHAEKDLVIRYASAD